MARGLGLLNEELGRGIEPAIFIAWVGEVTLTLYSPPHKGGGVNL